MPRHAELRILQGALILGLLLLSDGRGFTHGALLTHHEEKTPAAEGGRRNGNVGLQQGSGLFSSLECSQQKKNGSGRPGPLERPCLQTGIVVHRFSTSMFVGGNLNEIEIHGVRKTCFFGGTINKTQVQLQGSSLLMQSNAVRNVFHSSTSTSGSGMNTKFHN